MPDERFGYRASPLDVPELAEDPRADRRVAHGADLPHRPRTGAGARRRRGYARRYTQWGRELETTVGLAALNEARSVREVDRALLQVTWSENVVAVDDRGHLGYWQPGLHPLRPRSWDERLPYPGTARRSGAACFHAAAPPA